MSSYRHRWRVSVCLCILVASRDECGGFARCLHRSPRGVQGGLHNSFGNSLSPTLASSKLAGPEGPYWETWSLCRASSSWVEPWAGAVLRSGFCW